MDKPEQGAVFTSGIAIYHPAGSKAWKPRPHPHDSRGRYGWVAIHYSAAIGNIQEESSYFDQVMQLLHTCLFNQEKEITVYNAQCIQAVCAYIGVPFRVEISSRLQLDYSQVRQTDDWAITICKQLEAGVYYNPPGGIQFYKKERFSENEINLHFVNPRLKEYPQLWKPFTPSLSVVDVMMFNHPSEIKKMLNDFELI